MYMKRLLLTLFALMTVAMTGWGQANTSWYNTSETSFTIDSPEKLAGLAELVNDGTDDFEGKTIVLGNDIVLDTWLADGGGGNNSGKGWVPIGGYYDSVDRYFNGLFDGGGFTVSGLWINQPMEYAVGLFAQTNSSAHIRNLKVEIDNSVGAGIKGQGRVGGLVGVNKGKITGCAVLHKADETGAAIRGGSLYNYSGGLAGENRGEISNSYATVSLSGSIRIGEFILGGLVAENYGSISNCYATGNLTGSNESAGEYFYVSGLVGKNSGSISNCYATGDVTATGFEAYVSGLVAKNYTTGSISECYTIGAITETGDDLLIGGVVGRNEGEIYHSYFDSDVTPPGVGAYGVNDNDNPSEFVKVEGKTSEQLKNQYTFAQNGYWNFGYIWQIDQLVSAPTLRMMDFDTDWFDGDDEGTFTLTSAAELAGLGYLVSEGWSFKYGSILLGNNIDLTDWIAANSPTEGWQPIGNSYAFNGTFDGNGHTISGLWFNTPYGSYRGLFGQTDSPATIKNLIVAVDTDNVTPLNAGAHSGALIGQNYGLITNCAVKPMTGTTGTLMSSTTSYNIGGLAGVNLGTIENCYVIGNVYGQTTVGGIAGRNMGNIENCYVAGEVSGEGYPIGMLAGINDSGTIEASLFLGNDGEEVGQEEGTTSATALDAAGLKDLTNFIAAGWNFAEGGVWAIAPYATFNHGYPYLQIQPTHTVTLEVTEGYTYTVNEKTISTTTALAVEPGSELSFAYTVDTDNYTGTGEAEVDGVAQAAEADGTYKLTVTDNMTVVVTGLTAKGSGNPAPVITYHTLTLTVGEGLMTDKGEKTSFEIESGNPFSFVITLADGYAGQTPTVTVNGKVKDLITLGTDKWRCIISEVYEETEVRIGFNLTANEQPDAARIYSRSGQLIIETPITTTLSVYTVAGQTLISRRIPEGLTSLPLAKGIYIVRLGQRTEKVMVRD